MNSQLTDTEVTIKPEWVDQNGHLNLAYYILAFDQATDDFYAALGCDWDYLASEQHSMFTLGINADYMSEVFGDDTVRIATQILDHDHKRLHYFHTMYHAGEGREVATNECLAIHVDMRTRKSAPFGAGLLASIEAFAETHAALPCPARAFRKLGIKRRN